MFSYQSKKVFSFSPCSLGRWVTRVEFDGMPISCYRNLKKETAKLRAEVKFKDLLNANILNTRNGD